MKNLLMVRIACLTLSLGGAAYGQMAITNGPQWDATPGSIRVMAGTDSDVLPRLRWGTTTTNQVVNFPHVPAARIHAVTLTGLSPATAYRIQFCMVNPANSAESCSSTFTATTQSAVFNEDNAALPPDNVTLPLTPPERTGTQRIVGPDCLSPSNGLQYWLDNASFGDEIILPRSTNNCWGRFTYNRSTPSTTSFIVLKSDASPSELPPDGSGIIEAKVNMTTNNVNLNSPWESQLPTIWHNAPNYYYNPPPTLPSACPNPGAIVSDFGTSFRVFKCSVSTTRIPVTAVATGSSVVVTAPRHGYQTGNLVLLSEVRGAITLNDIWSVTVLDVDRFSLQVIQGGNATSTNAYTGGGSAQRLEWATVNFTRASGPPIGSCSAGQWYTDSSAPGSWWLSSVWRCVDENRWVRWLVENQAENLGGFDIAEGASNLYVHGIRFKAMKIPEEPEWRLSPVFGFTPQTGSAYLSMIKSRSTSKRIVFDRVVVDGSITENVRTISGFYGDGANIAFINSAIQGLGQWQRSYTLEAKNYGPNNNIVSSAIQISCGPGPGLFENNYLEAYGLTLFIDDGCPSSAINPPSNYTVRRNLFHRDDRYYEGSATWQLNPQSLKRRWNVRQVIEQKNGMRVLYEGNRIIGGWADGTGTACAFVFTPYNSPGAFVSNISQGIATVNSLSFAATQGLQVGDVIWFYWGSAAANGWRYVTDISTLPGTFGVTPTGANLGSAYFGKLNTRQTVSHITIRSNTVSTQSCGVQAWGLPFTRNQQSQAGGNYLIENNLFFRMDGRRGTPGSGFASLENGSAAYDFRFDGGVELAVVRHNTSIGRIASPSFGTPFSGMLQLDAFNTQGGGQSTGLFMRDNISTYGTYGVQRGSLIGQSALDAEFRLYQWTNNLLIRSQGPDSRFPASTQWTNSEASVGFMDPNSANFRLSPQSEFQSGGSKPASDGTALGADIDLLESKQGLIQNVRVIEATATTAQLGFTAPDAAACTVDWFQRGSQILTRTTIAPMEEQPPQVRVATLTGLPPGQQIDYRIICPAQIVTGSFTTATP
jgi:hypothetical protein